MVKKFQASRLSYRSSMINKNQGGGDKKQGTPPSVGTTFSFIRGLSRAYSPPKQRNMVFCINQGGGVGTRAYQTMAPFDGVRRPCKGERRLNSEAKAKSEVDSKAAEDVEIAKAMAFVNEKQTKSYKVEVTYDEEFEKCTDGMCNSIKDSFLKLAREIGSFVKGITMRKGSIIVEIEVETMEDANKLVEAGKSNLFFLEELNKSAESVIIKVNDKNNPESEPLLMDPFSMPFVRLENAPAQ